MQICLKYGRRELELRLDESSCRPILIQLRRWGASLPANEIVERAVTQPVSSPRLRDIVKPGDRVAILTSDITRPCPSDNLLPPLLAELDRAGVRESDITVVFGIGSHRPHTAEEQAQLVGSDLFARIRCIDSNPSDVRPIGRTSRGTPVEIFRPVVAADIRVCVGVIEYHYFAGYSGGVKAAIPGVCSLDTIQCNHRMMAEPGAVIGNLEDNPVRQDIEEAGELLGVHFILDAILDESSQIVGAVAGHPRRAFRAGCELLDTHGVVSVDGPMDVAVVSAGGFPRDINLYQAQKVLDRARLIVRPGGVILLVAECSEGMGNSVFEEWMADPGGSDAIIARIRRQFVLGGHKAAAVALTMKRASVFLVSDLPANKAATMGFRPFADPQKALQVALSQVDSPASVALMPEGGSVLPRNMV
ncbi:MAG: nickel-dependent lactate racemase [Chloroflexi bacterium]|nr:nickel-dependent lactate racemase [Chloroflexota bacterium]